MRLAAAELGGKDFSVSSLEVFALVAGLLCPKRDPAHTFGTDPTQGTNARSQQVHRYGQRPKDGQQWQN